MEVPGSNARGFGVTAAYLRNLIGPAVVAFYTAFGTLVAYMGWNNEGFEDWVERASAPFPQEFGD